MKLRDDLLEDCISELVGAKRNSSTIGRFPGVYLTLRRQSFLSSFKGVSRTYLPGIIAARMRRSSLGNSLSI